MKQSVNGGCSREHCDGAGEQGPSGGDGDDENRHEPHEAPDIAGVPLRYVQQSPYIHKYTQRDVCACACVKHNLVCVVFFFFNTG